MTFKNFLTLLLILLMVCPAQAADPDKPQEDAVIEFSQGLSMRDLATKYLGNPDDWRILLSANNLQHVSELKPGMKILIPVKQYRKIAGFIENAEEKMRLATMEGAAILSRENMQKAEELKKNALELRKNGNLPGALQAAQQAVGLAEKALAEAKAKKVQSVSAILTQKVGSVQERKPSESAWKDAFLNQELIEQERLRTLAASRAGIRFIDESIILMEENSMTVIGEMKENLIRKSFKADVKVLEGDVLVQLSSVGGGKDISVGSPGVNTTVRSTEFRTSRDRKEVTRIQNYNGEIDVEANKKSVKVGKDEGTKVEPGKAPESARKLLPPPEWISPRANQNLYAVKIRFEWKAVDGAKSYKLEIGKDPKFLALAESFRLDQTRYEWAVPVRGLYYCRLYSIDKDNFSGPFSEPLSFFADLDQSPPYLSLKSPKDGEILSSCTVTVEGTAEKQAAVTADGVRIPTDENGLFKQELTLEPGSRIIRVTASDSAGNTSVLERRVSCNTESSLISIDTPNPLISNREQIVIQGRIRPLTRVEINGKPVQLTETFSHVLKLDPGDHTLTFKASSPQGEVQELSLRIMVDLTPPQINLADFPTFTRTPTLILSGKISEDAELSVNAKSVPVDGKSFQISTELVEGKNDFAFLAKDPAGNTGEKKISVIRDTRGPEIGPPGFSPAKTNGGEIITVLVKAKDSGVGPAKTAGITLGIVPGPGEFSGVLTWNRDKEIFEGSIFIPPNVKGKAELKSLRIQDRLGNESILP
jgi:hypothetical protein